ncbi:MAG TPA: hypothetical protein VID28_01215 [Methylomirabilota bacterium]
MIATSDQDGARTTVLVRFTGIGWDLQERIEAIGRERQASPPPGAGLTP